MKSLLLTFAILFCITSSALGQQAQKTTLELKNDDLGATVRFEYTQLDNPQGVLIELGAPLNPGLDRAKLYDSWGAFAAQNNLEMVRIYVYIKDRAIYDPKTPNNLEDLVVRGVNQINTAKLPVCGICYIQDQMTCLAQIAASNKDFFKSLFLWDCDLKDQANTWATPSETVAYSTLVASNADSVFHKDAIAYADALRKNGSSVAAVTVSPKEPEKAMAFAQSFMLGALAPDAKAGWFEPSSKMVEPSPASNPAAVWLPTPALLDTCAAFGQTSYPVPRIAEYLVDKPVPGTVPLKFYVRFPVTLPDGADVKGVVCGVVPQGSRESIVQQLLKIIDPKDDIEKHLQLDGYLTRLIAFADKHQFAVVTWSTPGNWDSEKSYFQMTPDEAKTLNDQFNTLAEAWDYGMKNLISTYHLPSSDYLLYGESRGAQWAHRLVLRKPGYFMAVHVHICSSYDAPTPDAKKCLWLITTGEQEVGYTSSQRFYADAQKLGYNIIFKGQPNLGHEHSLAADKLGDAVFEYALAQQAKLDPGTQGFDFPSIADAQTTGDYLSQITSPPEQSGRIDDESKVFLPTPDIARLWTIIDPAQRGP